MYALHLKDGSQRTTVGGRVVAPVGLMLISGPLLAVTRPFILSPRGKRFTTLVHYTSKREVNRNSGLVHYH